MLLFGAIDPQGGLGAGTGIRREGIGLDDLSDCRGLDREVSGYHSRKLEDQYRYLFFDGVVLKSKEALRVQIKILLCAFGISAQGRQEIDFYPAASESAAAERPFSMIFTAAASRASA